MNATDQKPGFANNLSLQMTALVIVVAVLLVIAWKYLW